MAKLATRGENPAVIGLNIGQSWNVILPPVYRYLPKIHVDSFFETGELRLSSFAQFSQHSDEARNDANEGSSLLVAQGDGGTTSAFVVNGERAYILCGSFILSSEIMSKFPGCDAVIEITNPPNFAHEVARQLSGFRHGVSGYCIYANNRILKRVKNGPHLTLPKDGGSVDMKDILRDVGEIAKEEDLFIKKSKFAYQAEYRFVWNVDKREQDVIFLTAPKARQFCRRVDPEEYS